MSEQTTTVTPAAPSAGTILAAVIPMSELYPSPSNPRQHFEGLTDLAQSIQRKGIEQPLTVRERVTTKGRFEIVDGERRYRAGQQVGLQFVPVIQRTMTDAEVIEHQLENAIQRNNLTPLEEARGFKALLKASKATPAEIARRVSRSERWVADRLRLLDLRSELQQLLEEGRITIAHAEVLAKLKPEDQARAADFDGYRGRTGGLWVGEEPTLDYDGEDPDRSSNPYAGLKVATVKELEAWIARHVRLDVAHLVATAPLEFGRLGAQLELADAKAGTGKKVVHITHEFHLADEVKTKGCIYGPRSWRRADNTVGTVRDERTNKMVDAKPCEHAVLGLVVAGPEYGTAFDVCIARDKCLVHWKTEITEKKKREKLRAAGNVTQAEKRETNQRRQEEEKAKAANEKRHAFNALYRHAFPSLRGALLAEKPQAESAKGVDLLWFALDIGQKRPAALTTLDALVAHLVEREIGRQEPRGHSQYENHQWDFDRLSALAKVLGVNLAPLMKQAEAELKTAAQTAETAKPAKKAAKKR